MSDRIVPVKTWLRPATYRHWEAEGNRRGLAVAEVLSRLADAAIPAPVVPEQRAKYTRITAAMITTARGRIADGDSLTAIAAEYGCSRLGLRKALTRKRDTDERRQDAD